MTSRMVAGLCLLLVQESEEIRHERVMTASQAST